MQMAAAVWRRPKSIGRKRAKDGNRPSPASYYMHLPGQRASRCPQEDDLFRPSVAAIFVGVAWNALCAQHLFGRAFMAMLR